MPYIFVTNQVVNILNIVNMIQKYIFVVLVFTSILIVSCRQDEDLPTEKIVNTDHIFKKTGSMSQNSAKSTDSIANPPKNGTHWKVEDSIKLPIDDTNPPKNGTHWRIYN